jgi:hypothetical protein
MATNNQWENIPAEIQQHIISLLHPRNIVQMQQCSTELHAICQEVWKHKNYTIEELKWLIEERIAAVPILQLTATASSLDKFYGVRGFINAFIGLMHGETNESQYFVVDYLQDILSELYDDRLVSQEPNQILNKFDPLFQLVLSLSFEYDLLCDETNANPLNLVYWCAPHLRRLICDTVDVSFPLSVQSLRKLVFCGRDLIPPFLHNRMIDGDFLEDVLPILSTTMTLRANQEQEDYPENLVTATGFEHLILNEIINHGHEDDNLFRSEFFSSFWLDLDKHQKSILSVGSNILTTLRYSLEFNGHHNLYSIFGQ